MPSAIESPVPTCQAFYHRGFTLAVRPSAGEPGGALRFVFEVEHDGMPLHATEPLYRTAVAAERAARLFVDDALTAFEYATQALVA